MENKIIQELAKIGDVNPARLQIALKVVDDKKFIETYGQEPFARINLVVPQSVIKLFGGIET